MTIHITLDHLESVTDAIAVKENAISSKVEELAAKTSSLYRPCGSIAFADLPTPSAETLGNVYNITDKFTTTEDFIEGPEVECIAGTNVGIILTQVTDTNTGVTTEEYKYDLFSSTGSENSYVSQAQLTKAMAEANSYVKDVIFPDDDSNTITVTKGNGTSSSYTINVGKTGDVITDIKIDTSLTTDLGAIQFKKIKREVDLGQVSLYWTDPKDEKTADSWGETVIIKKKNGYPTSIEDGTLVLICAVRDRFKNSPYVDTQENPDDWYYSAFTIATTGAISSNLEANRFDFWHYAICIDEDNPIESECVSYVEGYDNENYTPLQVLHSTNIEENECDWGSWKNAPFMPRPCMLKYDGTVDYYLNPNDYTLKEDGTPSDVANTAYEGNAMMEFSPVFVKPVRVTTEASEDGTVAATSKLYIYFCSTKYDDDYECWSCKKADGTYADHYYMAIYEGTVVDSKLRSMSTGSKPTTYSSNLTSIINYAFANGSGYCCELWADIDLLRCLGILVCKRLHSTAAIGYGSSSTGSLLVGTGNKKGLFWGAYSTQTTYPTKFFGIENFWGHNYRIFAGLLVSSLIIYTKLTYSTIDGTSVVGYGMSTSGYTNTQITVPNGVGYLKTIQGNIRCITAPKSVGGTTTTYYSTYINQDGSYPYHGRSGSSSELFSWNYDRYGPSGGNPVYAGGALSYKGF